MPELVFWCVEILLMTILWLLLTAQEYERQAAIKRIAELEGREYINSDAIVFEKAFPFLKWIKKLWKVIT